jgi:hypothetical protein
VITFPGWDALTFFATVVLIGYAALDRHLPRGSDDISANVSAGQNISSTRPALSRRQITSLGLGTLFALVTLGLMLTRPVMIGPAGPEGKRGPPGPAANITDVTQRVDALGETLNRLRLNVARVFKLEYCLDNLNTQAPTDEIRKSATSIKASMLATNGLMGLHGVSFSLYSTLQVAQQVVADCYPQNKDKFVPYIANEDEIHRYAPDEPKDEDAKYRYRKTYWELEHNVEMIETLRSQLKEELSQLKVNISRQN